MNLKEQRAAAVKDAEAIVSGAKAAARNLTADEAKTVEDLLGTVRDIDAQLAQAAKSADLLRELGELSNPGDDNPPAASHAKDIGEHFVKSGAFDKLKNSVGQRFSVSAPEFKAATDPALLGSLGRVDYGGVVATRYRRLTIADLLAQGTIANSSLTYWTQGTVTGDFATVAEVGTKPSLNFAFSQVTEALSKIAGVTKVSDEMVEDAEYLVSVIRSQLLLRLGLVEEDQLLNGNGTAPNVRGILNRSGIQTETGASKADNLDAIFRAITKVQTGSELTADGIVVNPTDYQAFRLSKDGNSQYYAGGPFTGAYGNGGIQTQPGLWGLQTVVTSAIATGTVLVGAFAAAAQMFRKGGVRVESTNSNEDDFKKNLVAIRAEERVALAVYVPTGFVKVTLGTT